MGSMVRFTPPPCGRATRVVIKVEGSPEGLHTGLGSGAPHTPRFRPHPRISRRPSIVKLHVSKLNPPILTSTRLMVKLNAGSLYQHGECRGRLKECRCRLKKTLDGHPEKATQWDNIYSPWTSTNSPPRPSRIFKGRNSLYTPIPSVILLVEGKGDFIAQMQIKITKGYQREAIERYKHIATIFPVLGRNELRRKAPSP